MKRSSTPVAALIALFLAGVVLAQTTGAPATRPRGPRGPRGPAFDDRNLAGKVESGTLASKLLGSEIDYRVYLPPGYKDPANAGRRYPVIFFLHGLWENPGRWFGRGGGEAFDTAIKE